MLGEMISESKGKVSSRRVLPSELGPKVEVSYESMSRLLNIEARDLGTYWSQVRPDGTVYGEGQGVIMGKNGEAATWKASGVGVFQPDGGTKFRGALYYQTQTESLAQLNKIACVFEYDEDADGNIVGKLWEWK